MPDPADQAQQLADLFTKLAGEVDAFRNQHYDEMSSQQRTDLEEEIQRLYDFHDQFVGDAIQNTLNAMQGDLSAIANVTRQATQALQHLKTIQQIVDIVSAASTLAADIVTGDYGAIPEAVRSVAQAIQGPSDKDISGA